MKKLEVKKIENKLELKDMEINSDPCKSYWDKKHLKHEYDCDYDCKTWYGKVTPEQSTCY